MIKMYEHLQLRYSHLIMRARLSVEIKYYKKQCKFYPNELLQLEHSKDLEQMKHTKNTKMFRIQLDEVWKDLP